ncbi:MAG: glycogen debranching enzyme GlgX, partial [Nitrospirota bacterium]|nr:glycogen debranching enzyme GlgX [Nitrospirota bacterium]
HWDITDEQQEFLMFVRTVIEIRKTHPVFQRRKFFQGRRESGADVPDISWFQPSGDEMSDDAWNAGFSQCLGVRFPGDLIGDVNERGEPITGDSIVLLINAHYEPLPFRLPSRGEGQEWELLIDTADPLAKPIKYKGHTSYDLQGRSIAVFRSKPPGRKTSGVPK